MNKLVMKKVVGISDIFPNARAINFTAPLESIEDFKNFGNLMHFESMKDSYQLRVDPRYDFDEVKKYIENY